MDDIVIVGAGIGGLTLALQLHDAGIPCRIYEAAPELAPIGAGINVLPHATAVLDQLGLVDRLAGIAVATKESAFYNRFGQLVYREPAGRAAGHPNPQFSVHRGDLQFLLLDAVRERLGPDAVTMGWRCTGATQRGDKVEVSFESSADGAELPGQVGSAVIGCDGIHSVLRKQLHPDEGAPRYSGVMMWRGVSVWTPFLTGASMVRAGWLSTGKMVIYPVRENVDGAGRQLVNWVAELETPARSEREWNRGGRLEDFIEAFAAWNFDWLDVPSMIRAADTVLEYPMVDQDPLPLWTEGRITLLGDAAHPMVPRGSNGAGQAIVDTQVLREQLTEQQGIEAALRGYEQRRLPATSAVVLANRENPPDAILREVYERTGDRPFTRVDDVIRPDELADIAQRYRKISGAVR